MLSALALMSGLLLAQEGQALLQSCVLEDSGWVCRYRVPQGIQPTTPVTIKPSSTPPPEQTIKPSAESIEAARQERLIRRCADASWMSLCTPGDRREAKALQEAAAARAKLRLEVTTLAGDGKCPDAVRVALQGGDLVLAREIREFCATAK